MNKNSLIQIVFEKPLQRSQSQKIKGSRMASIENNSNNKTERMTSVNQSNKLIKITQFNSGLVLKERRATALPVHNSHSSSPYKQFTLKKVRQHIGKQFVDSDRIVEQELRRREIQYRSGGKQSNQELDSPKRSIKMFTTTKWNFRNQLFDINMIANQIVGNHSVVVVRPLNAGKKKEQKQEETDFDKNKLNTKTANSRNRVKEHQYSNFSSIKGRQETSYTGKLSVSPRKKYNQHLEQQKRYQENLEKEKRQLLQMRQQLKKNYAKPFNPPENVSAYAYIIFEADCQKKNRLRKLSARKVEMQMNGKLYQHSHKAIASCNSRTALEMASLTKIMTCLVAIQIARRYSLDLAKEQITVGSFEANTGGTSANIKKGQIYTALQLLYGLMLPSGNDASISIAIWGGKILLKSEKQLSLGQKWKKKQCYDRFLAQMNAKAAQLHMEKTKYSNSHGLSNSQNKSCCFDLGILCEYAMKNPLFRKIVSSRQYETQIKVEAECFDGMRGSCRDSKKWLKKKISLQNNQKMELEEMKDLDDVAEINYNQEDDAESEPSKHLTTRRVRWQNTHQLLQSKPDLYIGIKTGVTATAGPCLASCVQVNKRRFMIVILNCKSMKHRMKDTQILRRWLFQKEGIKRDEKDMILMDEMNTA